MRYMLYAVIHNEACIGFHRTTADKLAQYNPVIGALHRQCSNRIGGVSHGVYKVNLCEVRFLTHLSCR